MLERRQIGQFTWYCDVLAFLLTLVYSAMVISDISRGGAHLTNAEWFKQGFCVWKGADGSSSHSLCVRYDLPLGALTTLINGVNYWRLGGKMSPGLRTGLKIAIAGSFFNVLHGLGHYEIQMKGGDLGAMHPSKLLWPEFMKAYLGVCLFLGIGPFLGYFFRVPILICVLAHLPSSFAFLYLPPQFGFGAVQLVIILWYCLPRIFWIGWEEEEDLALRVENGWAVASMGNVLLLLPVFSEAFACEAFYKNAGGHVIYDGSILLITFLQTVALWRQGNQESFRPKKS